MNSDNDPMTVSKSTRTGIFICYCHVDLHHLNRLKMHLAPFVRNRKIDYWVDTMIKPGSEWLEEIKQAISSAKVAIFLVSADFLASEFIAEIEIPPLLVAAQREEAILMSVILSYCAFEHSELYKYQAINPQSKPLGSMSKSKREEVWANLTRQVVSTLNC